MTKQDQTVKTLLGTAGRTYADEAGILVKDQPAPLFRLLVLANLLSARVSADIAVAAARELFEAGATTARAMARLDWQQRVDALGRAHYVRYDEGTATRLGDMAEMVQHEYGGDLRLLAKAASCDMARGRELLLAFPGIGPAGTDIFCREAQVAWPWLRPYFDELTLKGAARLGLPTDPKRLADLVKERDLARLAAALVRVVKDKKVADILLG